MSLVTDKPPYNGEEPKIAPPDFQRAITPLAPCVQEIMASLYPLQSVLTDAAAWDKQPRISVSSLREGRNIFRADWERYSLFLQHCRTYAGDYISLCEYVTTQPSTCLVFSKNVLDMGTKIYEEVSGILVTHRQIYRELLTYGTESSSESSRAMPLTRYSSANTDGHESITTDLLVQIIKSNKASVRPDGTDVFAAIQTALREIETSLADMKVFWNYQVDELTGIISKPDAIFMINLSESVKRWKCYDAAIIASITSISESSDAITVSSPTEHTTSTIEYQVEPEAKCEATAGQQREVANKEAGESMATEKTTSAKEESEKVAMEAAVAALVAAKEKAAAAAAAATERKADMEAAVAAVVAAEEKAAIAAIAENKAKMEAVVAAAIEKAAAEKVDMRAVMAAVVAAKKSAVAAIVAAGKKAEMEATAAAVAAAQEKVAEVAVAEKKAEVEAIEAAMVAVAKTADMKAAVAAMMAAKEKAVKTMPRALLSCSL